MLPFKTWRFLKAGREGRLFFFSGKSQKFRGFRSFWKMMLIMHTHLLLHNWHSILACLEVHSIATLWCLFNSFLFLLFAMVQRDMYSATLFCWSRNTQMAQIYTVRSAQPPNTWTKAYIVRSCTEDTRARLLLLLLTTLTRERASKLCRRLPKISHRLSSRRRVFWGVSQCNATHNKQSNIYVHAASSLPTVQHLIQAGTGWQRSVYTSGGASLPPADEIIHHTHTDPCKCTTHADSVVRSTPDWEVLARIG